MFEKFLCYFLDKKIDEFGILDIGSYSIKFSKVKISYGEFFIEKENKIPTLSISKGLIIDGKKFEEELVNLLKNTNLQYIYILLPLSNFLVKGHEEVTIPYDFGIIKVLDENVFKDLFFKFKEEKDYLYPNLKISHICPYEFILDGQKVKNIINLSGKYLEVKAYPFFLQDSYTTQTISSFLKRKKYKPRHFLSQAVCLVSKFIEENLEKDDNVLLVSFNSSGVESVFLQNSFIAWSHFTSKVSIKNILRKLANTLDIPFIEIENYFVHEGIRVLKRRSYTLKVGKRSFHTFKIVNAILKILKGYVKEIIYLLSKKGYRVSRIYITGYPLKFKDFKDIFFDPKFLEINLKIDPWEPNVNDFDYKNIEGFLSFLKLNFKKKHILDMNFEPYEILNL